MSVDQVPSPPGPLPDSTSGVSADEAETFLVVRFGAEVTDVEPMGGGAWSKAYAFRRGGSDYVARFGAFPEDFAKDQLAGRYASPDLPIPVVTEIGRAFDGFYAISERSFGGFIDELDGEGIHAVLPSLFAALDAARSVDLSATAGYGPWDSTGRAPYPSWRAALLDIAADRPGDRGHGWRERLEASATGAERFDEALDHLRALAEFCPEERHLIHSDLLHFNVLVAGDRISAVFDWGNALYGDFLYDLAWFAFWSPWYPAWHGIDFREEAARHFAAIGLEVPHVEERFRCCQVHIGLDGQKYQAFVGDWEHLETTARRTLAVARGGE
ncbi:MAG: hygromycin-B 4-O-kinase [Thermomicrobiales bacterium]|nr:hygromycin-B 4-O-kinase [Thermomicrobiales bacterium]